MDTFCQLVQSGSRLFRANLYMDGQIPVLSQSVLNLDNLTASSLAMSTIQNDTVLFIGTSNSTILKVHLKKIPVMLEGLGWCRNWIVDCSCMYWVVACIVWHVGEWFERTIQTWSTKGFSFLDLQKMCNYILKLCSKLIDGCIYSKVWVGLEWFNGRIKNNLWMYIKIMSFSSLFLSSFLS